MSHQRDGADQTPTHPVLSTWTPSRISFGAHPLISLAPAWSAHLESLLSRLVCLHPSASEGESCPTTTSSNRQLSRRPSIGANQRNRVDPNPTLPGPAHGYINLQPFVSSAHQCRQCRHQCNHLLACSLTRSLTLLYFAFHCLHRYKVFAYLHACRVQSGQSKLPCYAWRPFRIRSATADPPCCCCCRCCCYCCCYSCRWSLVVCFVPSQRPAPTTWDLGSGIGIRDTPSRVIR